MGEIFLQAILFIYNTIGFQNLGLAIIEVAILTRVVFYPFAKQQAHYSRKMAELGPQLKALKETHKGNQQAMAMAQAELFKQHGVNPMAGCLPAIVQIVVLFALLWALNNLFAMNLNRQLWIWDMAKPDAYHFSGIPFALPGILVIVAALTQFVQTKMMIPSALPVPQDKALVKKEEKKEFMEEFAEAQSSMLWMFPLMFLFLGTQWPSGLALYWSVGSLLAIWQQYRISGFGSLEQYIVKFRRGKNSE